MVKKNKLRIFNTNVKAVLLYAADAWRTTVNTTKRIQNFVNSCTCKLPVEQEIRQRCWRWIGHTLRKPADSITRQALTWNPECKRNGGRPRNTWRCDLEGKATSKKLAKPETVGDIGSGKCLA